MPTHTTLGSLFSDIADAIREKDGTSATIKADTFPDRISAIDTDPSGDATATAGDILSPKTAYSQGAKITGTIQTKNDSGNTTLDTTTTSKSYAAGYYPSAHGAAITLESKTGASSIAPTESSQTITPTSGKVLSAVEIDAIPSDYVGSGITQRSSSDLTASGATVTAPAGYYASQATKSVASGSATTPTDTITANPTISFNSTSGKIEASYSGSKSITPTVNAGYISSGTAGTISTSGSASVTPSSLDAGIAAANIKDGVNILGTAGTFTDSSTITGSGKSAAAAGDILTGKATFLDGAQLDGTMTNNGATGGTISTQGGTYAIPAGYTSGGTVTASLPAMTLPTAAAASADGTNKATITAGSSDQYINIPTGYNSAKGSYKINAIASMTLPTSTSSTSSGTQKAAITVSGSDQYINIPTGYNGTAAYYKINAVTAYDGTVVVNS